MANYWDCVKFWQLQGVEKEDNLIALALNDCNELTEYYRGVYNRIVPVIMSVKDKSTKGFLIGLGL